MGILQMKIELTGVRGILPVIASADIASIWIWFPVTMHPEIAFGDLAETLSCFWPWQIPEAASACHASLNYFCSLGGYLLSPQSIPGGEFFCVGMNSARENNPCRRIPLYGDKFGSEK